MTTIKNSVTGYKEVLFAVLDLPFIRKLYSKRWWIKFIDLAIVLTLILLSVSDAKIFYFHLIFIILTVGAFYWQFQAFVVRTVVTISAVVVAMFNFVWMGNLPVEELVEIPLLTTILILVFAIAWQRAKAEDALWKINEELEQRVYTRTAALSKEITEREKAERILIESEERYRQLVQLSFEAIAIHTEAELVYLNPAGKRLLGIAGADELGHKAFLNFIHPDSLETVGARLQLVRETNQGAPLTEEKFMRADGAHVDVEIVTIPIVYQGRAALQTVIRDITVRKQMEQIRMAERVNIARDLHDSLGQSLGYLHLKLDELAGLEITQSSAKQLRHLCDVANNAYEQVRNLLAALRSTNTSLLTAVLRAKAQLVSQQAHFQVQVINRGQEVTLPPVFQQQILLLCSEALANVTKHAHAHHVRLELHWTPEILTITIEDDGCGFDLSAPRLPHSYGLRIMQERAIEMGGVLSIHSQCQVGTKLTLQVLLPAISMGI